MCREWADVGVNLLAKRTFLQLHKLFRYDDASKLFQVNHVDSKLTQRLIIYNTLFPSIPTNDKTSVLTEAIRMLDSTKIQNISVFFKPQKFRGLQIPKGKVQPCRLLPILSNLTSIKFELFGIIREKTRNSFHPVLQILIDAAPNLTSLDVSGSFYPNLEGCKKLKILKLFNVKCADTRICPKLDVAAVTRMLAQVKDSLEEMELRHIGGVVSQVSIKQTMEETLYKKSLILMLSSCNTALLKIMFPLLRTKYEFYILR